MLLFVFERTSECSDMLQPALCLVAAVLRIFTPLANQYLIPHYPERVFVPFVNLQIVVVSCVLNFYTKIVKFFYKNYQVFLQKLSHFLAKSIKFSYKNCQIFLYKLSNFPVKIVKFSWKNHHIFLQIPSNSSIKIINFRTKIVKISLQKSSNFPAKLDRFYFKNIKFSSKYH